MRLDQSGALLTGAHNELIHRGGVLADGPGIAAAGPLEALMAEYPIPVDERAAAGIDEMAATGIYVCPTMNVHAHTLLERFGDALER